jgi:hypothetical protein
MALKTLYIQAEAIVLNEKEIFIQDKREVIQFITD